MSIPLFIFYLLLLAWVVVGVASGMFILYVQKCYAQAQQPDESDEHTFLIQGSTLRRSGYLSDDELSFDGSDNYDESLMSVEIAPVNRFEWYMYIV
ncbi:hypothetical protein F4813DRAFT_365848 [Daldinia decipiens]|uniref:uncharacterized protein n=1 Tax=Daldinia decipiens TaxID=326647 RepID=UPI0020C5A769|nr:uncharacterized protein F4813DRAFT_365848 [Daldinia decipiens]KAI1655942.1 hypothetical protein F4813DRAFT_365848 [Daldinia decipiens]